MTVFFDFSYIFLSLPDDCRYKMAWNLWSLTSSHALKCIYIKKLIYIYLLYNSSIRYWTLSKLFCIFIIKGFRTIVFIFIISTMFRPICPPAFFRCLLNSGTFTELRTMSFIETTGVACSGSVSHNQVQVLSIPVLLLACSEDWTCNLQMIVSLEA